MFWKNIRFIFYILKVLVHYSSRADMYTLDGTSLVQKKLLKEMEKFGAILVFIERIYFPQQFAQECSFNNFKR